MDISMLIMFYDNKVVVLIIDSVLNILDRVMYWIIGSRCFIWEMVFHLPKSCISVSFYCFGYSHDGLLCHVIEAALSWSSLARSKEGAASFRSTVILSPLTPLFSFQPYYHTAGWLHLFTGNSQVVYHLQW
jgi:hypothetical protein